MFEHGHVCIFDAIDGVCDLYMYHWQRIPPAFTKFIHKEAPRKAILKGPSGCHWIVNVRVSGNGSDRPSYYFKAGWEAFVKDHRLHEHDFLLFKYCGGMRFSVLIFDKTACEREDAFRVKNSTLDDARGKLRSRQGAENIPMAKKRTREQFETGFMINSQQLCMPVNLKV